MRTVIIIDLHKSDEEEFYDSNWQYFLNAKNLLAYEKELEDLTKFHSKITVCGV